MRDALFAVGQMLGHFAKAFAFAFGAVSGAIWALQAAGLLP